MACQHTGGPFCSVLDDMLVENQVVQANLGQLGVTVVDRDLQMFPIPITVFTGFLGAGKTSIILSLLPQLPENYRAVLLKNEFGDLEGSGGPCSRH